MLQTDNVATDNVANGRCCNRQRRKRTTSRALRDCRAPHRRATLTEDRDDGARQLRKEPTTYRKRHGDGEVAGEDLAMEKMLVGVDGIDGDGNVDTGADIDVLAGGLTSSGGTTFA